MLGALQFLMLFISLLVLEAILNMRYGDCFLQILSSEQKMKNGNVATLQIAALLTPPPEAHQRQPMPTTA
jgi:hypothetical protein